ncbi:hypothetical protein I5907_11975 [Panacibacter sp. DH6]|uniref:Uncharacterized protein n=1 Tax=Panacibacter microcysteis TaxID=2793269 RepID=A0A931E879_9BACT|nr:hypothetical protein [Panacibacter microcysteis]MBG9376954.1 hypothetical protein [Panacibacter microcysteis]
MVKHNFGIGKSTVIQYINRKKEPRANFIQKFYEQFDEELKKVAIVDTSVTNYRTAPPITLDKISSVILRTYALQQVGLSVLAELLAEKTGASVTATQSELLKAVEAEEVKMREALRELQ